MSGWTVSKKRRVQQQISDRDGGSFCHYCKIELAIDNELPLKGTLIETDDPDLGPITTYSLPQHIKHAFIEHKHPRHLGGTDDLDNLVLACRWCNGKKGTTPYAEYIAKEQSP